MRRTTGVLRSFVPVLALVVAGCDVGGSAHADSPTETMVDDKLRDDLHTIRAARIFFGHHSVGKNVLEGVAAISAEAGVPIEILPLGERRSGGEGRIEHARIAENKKPYAKVDAFVEKVEDAGGETPQIALMKFCYVDFDPDTDVDDLFRHYQQTMSNIQARHPEVALMHVTVPLMARPTGLKVQIDRLLGRLVWRDAANLKRSAFNEKLRAAYASEPIFDVAAVESTRPDGSRESFRYQGQDGHALWQGYTSDGGHLNPLGQRVAARALIRELAEAVRSGKTGAAAQR